MILQKTYNFLSSAKLAIALLVIILVCCVTGVTVFSMEKAWTLIFRTLWFNALLVLLVANVIFCFFPRIWGRKITLISLGMILFHLSFVAILGGIIYNSMFYFKGIIRLAEGESLRSEDPLSYDSYDHGRYFNFAWIKGETTLNKLYTEYMIDGVNKKVAYDITVGDGRSKKQGIVYITHSLEHGGFSYFREKEGYSVLVVLSDMRGRELYGAFIPLQSFLQKDKSYTYSTGTADAPGSMQFPQSDHAPVFALQVVYKPTPIKERAGEAVFRVWPLDRDEKSSKPLIEGKAYIGERSKAGDYQLEVREVRYWIGMNVRYEPGKPMVLTSLWVGFGGIILTFLGRIRRGGNQQSAVSAQREN